MTRKSRINLSKLAIILCALLVFFVGNSSFIFAQDVIGDENTSTDAENASLTNNTFPEVEIPSDEFEVNITLPSPQQESENVTSNLSAPEFNSTLSNDTLVNYTISNSTLNSTTNSSAKSSENSTLEPVAMQFPALNITTNLTATNATNQTNTSLVLLSNIYVVGTIRTFLAYAHAYSASLLLTILTSIGPAAPQAYSASFSASIGSIANASGVTIQIESYDATPSTLQIGQTVTFSLEASLAQERWVRITLPDTTQQVLTFIGPSITYVPTQIGLHSVTFFARSSQNVTTSIADSFTVTMPAPPSSGGSSGSTSGSRGSGGSSGSISFPAAACSWDCSPWSLCQGGFQKRICEGSSSCAPSSAPAELIECSAQLFDILVSVNKGTFNSSHLDFTINLTEVASGELVDAYLVYTVYQELDTGEEKEVYRHVETRAVQNNTVFNKALTDMNLANGTYELRVDIVYGNLQQAYARIQFAVGEAKEVVGQSVQNTTDDLVYALDDVRADVQFAFIVVIGLVASFGAGLLLLKKRTQPEHPNHILAREQLLDLLAKLPVASQENGFTLNSKRIFDVGELAIELKYLTQEEFNQVMHDADLLVWVYDTLHMPELAHILAQGKTPHECVERIYSYLAMHIEHLPHIEDAETSALIK